MNGILLVNKEKEYTSHDVVAIIKKITGEKVGHTGTLDQNATGVLPLLIGKATLISKYLINHDKEYIATIKLGVKTDTADGEGKVLEEHNLPISEYVLFSSKKSAGSKVSFMNKEYIVRELNYS